MNGEEKLMRLCIKLAEKGKGYVSPNPLVGCVICKDGKIIGKGYHKKFGEAHAEVNAVKDAKKNGYDLRNSEVYVNLEPCAHSGKTGPCVDLLINEKVSKVFIGMKDPFLKVNGKGIRKLKDAGIKVITGILEKECQELNKFFIKNVKEHLPFVTLKIAQSIDGIIALNDHSSKWITGDSSRKFVHKLRSVYDAVLIGKNTAIYDNPSLSVRDVKGRDPYRIVIDKDLKLSRKLKLFTDNNCNKTFVLTGFSNKPANKKSVEHSQNVIFVKEKNGKLLLKDALKKLYDLNIGSILLEGGANVFSQFIKDDLFDDAYFFNAPKIIGKGISSFGDLEISSLSKAKNIEYIYSKTFDKDILIYYKNVHRNSTGSGKSKK
ncbi:MAG TPA: bifunctional diaminohydroxyphosphoribosylaminopyrimidine deaminase/5-amino-6-(5-phosphoribosylamino)uracil reductase RibD [Ignavibacteria bacterium]|nr:bifunctional diaminohydroxyphosphoribosylaminopyrimidine deaminase/5-amino-6-(5-phosphoribosylamino)uracil reductase RibD [Ignavibacteria bacterium]